ncbi:MAG: hypothetical protein V4696_02505 [Pseudomonadota bacterium]
MGIAVSGAKAVLVTAVEEAGKPLEIVADDTIDLHSGDRAEAYKIIHDKVSDRVAHNKVNDVFIKASAWTSGMKLAHLEAAELRGVVIAAAGTSAKVHTVSSAQITKTFGKRKFEDYVKDDSFWPPNISGVKLRSGSRPAALLLIAARD